MKSGRVAFGAAVALGILYTAVFAVLAFRRFDSFGTWALDMGNMDQAVWNTIHGRPLAFTNMEGITSRLAIHAEPTLILISPIYLLWSDPRALLLLQTVALASGVLPVFWIAAKELKSRWAALVVSACYLLFPSLEAVNMAEFHPVALSAPLLLWAYHLGNEGKWTGYAILSAAAAGTKEEVGLVVALLGLYLAVVKRSRAPGIVALGGVLWSLGAILVVIPTFSPTSSSPYAGYYSQMGGNLVEVSLYLLTHPLTLFQRFLSEQKYLESLLIPWGYLSLLSPERLLVGLPSLLINLLSNNGEMQRPNMYHYTAPLIPALVIATVAGIGRAAGLLARFGLPWKTALSIVTGLLLLSGAIYHREEGLSPISSHFSLPPITAHDRIGYEVLDLVPGDASLSVHPDLNSHLSQRQKLYVFPYVGDAEYVLMDRLRDVSSRDPVHDPSEAHRRRLATLEELIRGGTFSVLLDRDGYVLLKRAD